MTAFEQSVTCLQTDRASLCRSHMLQAVLTLPSDNDNAKAHDTVFGPVSADGGLLFFR